MSEGPRGREKRGEGNERKRKRVPEMQMKKRNEGSDKGDEEENR